MPVRAINNNYQFEPRDQQANYQDNILLYIGWDAHLLFCSAKAFLINPNTTFGDVLDTLMPAGFSQHPDFKDIDWTCATFNLDGTVITPNREQKLSELGVMHKSLLRFATPLSPASGTAKV